MPRMTTRTDHADDAHTRKENPDVICPECRKPLKKSSLHGHTKRFHRPDEWFPCDDCEYIAKCKSDQADHERYHTGSKDFKCEDDPEQCSKAFCNKANLQHHRERRHGFVPPGRRRAVRFSGLELGFALHSSYGSASSHASSSTVSTPSSAERELAIDDSALYADPGFDFGTRYNNNDIVDYFNGQAACTTPNFDYGLNPAYPADHETQYTGIPYPHPQDVAYNHGDQQFDPHPEFDFAEPHLQVQAQNQDQNRDNGVHYLCGSIFQFESSPYQTDNGHMEYLAPGAYPDVTAAAAVGASNSFLSSSLLELGLEDSESNLNRPRYFGSHGFDYYNF
ncbi:hypothetical protein CPB84DRAFT_1965850 [Gymnopilus junonius]|uniref:C2H2-type domain-containing protein n=1 Tax=Gymnopilus junonius TaxID=109634 RepID=A0A9P5NCV9_GYMJU|nr:hypothetical protein CPB84DRAFT_1965850 [Gymnopilus junonius]